MIFSNLEIYKNNKNKYPEVFQKALDYLVDNDIVNMAPGEYEIQGRDIYVKVLETKTKKIEDASPEVHNKYIDIQCTFIGSEKMGFAVKEDGVGIKKDNLEAKDILYYEEVNNENFAILDNGKFVILFPSDIHRPLVAIDEPIDVKKVIVKVNMSLV